MDIIYGLEIKKADQKRLIKKNKLLRVELDSLRRLERIERIAKKELGLVSPGNGQVVFVTK